MTIAILIYINFNKTEKNKTTCNLSLYKEWKSDLCHASGIYLGFASKIDLEVAESLVQVVRVHIFVIFYLCFGLI